MSGGNDEQTLFHRIVSPTARGLTSTTAVVWHLKVKNKKCDICLVKTYCITVSIQKRDILYECLKDLKGQLKELRKMFLESKENQIKGAEQLTELTESVKFINEKFDKYEEERNKKDVIIEELKKENANLKEHLKDVEENVDRQEQYSTRNCLLIHGIKEERNENTDDIVVRFIQDDLQEEINFGDLDRTHRES